MEGRVQPHRGFAGYKELFIKHKQDVLLTRELLNNVTGRN